MTKVTYTYVISANYFRTFPNFRFIYCVVPINKNITQAVPATFSCPVSPPLVNTSATFVTSVYGIDLVALNSSYSISQQFGSFSAVSVSNYSLTIRSNFSVPTYIKNVYYLVVSYMGTLPYASNFKYYANGKNQLNPTSISYTANPGTFYIQCSGF